MEQAKFNRLFQIHQSKTRIINCYFYISLFIMLFAFYFIIYIAEYKTIEMHNRILIIIANMLIMILTGLIFSRKEKEINKLSAEESSIVEEFITGAGVTVFKENRDVQPPS